MRFLLGNFLALSVRRPVGVENSDWPIAGIFLCYFTLLVLSVGIHLPYSPQVCVEHLKVWKKR